MSIEYDKDEYGIPPHMQGGLRRYIEQGIPPGGFLQAVITNDLQGAVGRADKQNARLLEGYVKFLYNQAPRSCWGSTDAYEAWLERGGLEGDE